MLTLELEQLTKENQSLSVANKSMKKQVAACNTEVKEYTSSVCKMKRKVWKDRLKQARSEQHKQRKSETLSTVGELFEKSTAPSEKMLHS